MHFEPEMKTLNKAKDKLINGGGLFMFLRSSVAAQAASWVDLGLGFVLFSWVGLSTGLSTGIGAVAGGIINCIINYRFTFHAKGVSKRAVAVKYILSYGQAACCLTLTAHRCSTT